MRPSRVRAVLLTAILSLGGVVIVLLLPSPRTGLRDAGARPEASRPSSAHIDGGMPPSTLQPRPDRLAVSDGEARSIGGAGDASPDEEDAASFVPEEEVGFLPYPNRGERDFAEKYDSLSAKELHYRVARLNETMSEVARKEAESRFETGQYVVHEPPRLTGGETEEDLYFDKPVGLGRVWPCSTVVGLEGGHPELRVTYLTEVEHPELFAMRDEWLYAARLWKKKWSE